MRCTFGTGSKADPLIQTPFAALFWPVGKSDASTTRPVRNLHPEDVDTALDIDRYDFALGGDFEEGRLAARAGKTRGKQQRGLRRSVA